MPNHDQNQPRNQRTYKSGSQIRRSTGQPSYTRPAASGSMHRPAAQQPTRAAQGRTPATPPRGGGGGNGGGQTGLNIMLAVLSGLLAISIMVAIVLPMILRAGLDDAEPPVSGADSSAPAGEDYDKEENAIPVELYTETILQESEDAGQAYVEETLFIGDSNTYRMMLYSDVTYASLANCIGVEGMGINAVTTLPCVQFKGQSGLVTIPTAVKTMQPLRIVITFGTNNLGGNVNSFVDGYRTAIKAIQEAYPYSSIIIGAVPPVSASHTYGGNVTMTNIDRFNLALVDLASEMDVKFLNWTETLKDDNTGYIKAGYTLEDGIHLNRNAMEAMFNYLRTHSYIVEDTRPKPLNAIPERSETPPGLILSDPSAGSRSGSRSSSSSSTATTEVVFSTLDVNTNTSLGGYIVMGDTAKSTITVEVEPGKTAPSVKAVANDGYKFSHWSCTVGRIADIKNPVLENFLIFATVSAGDTVYVTAHFEKQVVSSNPVILSIVVSATQGGSVSGDISVQNAYPGQVYTFTATPAANYRFVGWTSNGGAVANATAATTTFTVPADSKTSMQYTFTANFEYVAPVITGTISVTAGEGGSVSGETSVSDAKPGRTITITATPAQDYIFAGWSGAGVADPAALTTTFTVPADAANGFAYSIVANFTYAPPVDPPEGMTENVTEGMTEDV